MRITNISSDVRIVNYGSPFELENDIRVEECVNGEWTIRWHSNSLSNDYAYTEAQDIAESIERTRRLYRQGK